MTNSVDSDQEQSDLGPHCFHLNLDKSELLTYVMMI